MVVLFEGRAMAEVVGKCYAIVSCDTTCVPTGIFHRFINQGMTPMRILCVYGAIHVTGTLADTGDTLALFAMPLIVGFSVTMESLLYRQSNIIMLTIHFGKTE